MKRGLYDTLERMCSDTDTIIIVQEQMDKFKTCAGLFGRSSATLTRDKKQPGEFICC